MVETLPRKIGVKDLTGNNRGPGTLKYQYLQLSFMSLYPMFNNIFTFYGGKKVSVTKMNGLAGSPKLDGCFSSQ